MNSVPPSWEREIEAWVLVQRSAAAPATTIRDRVQHLRNLARGIGVECPWDVTEEQLITFSATREWMPETRRARRNTFRIFWDWGITTGKTDTNPADSLPKVKPAVPKPRPCPDIAYAQAYLAAAPREQLMLRLAAELGLRRAEVAGIHHRDLSHDNDGWILTIRGKGGRVRLLPLPPGLFYAIRDRAQGGYLFPGDRNGHLSPEYVGKRIAALLPDGLTMHTLRHRFATKAYGVNRDVFAVQDLLGHVSPATTRRYVAVPGKNLRETIMAVAA